MHSISGRFCSGVPGMLMNHSVLVSCAARSDGLAQLDRDVGRGGAEIDRLRAVEIVADGANA